MNNLINKDSWNYVKVPVIQKSFKFYDDGLAKKITARAKQATMTIITCELIILFFRNAHRKEAIRLDSIIELDDIHIPCNEIHYTKNTDGISLYWGEIELARWEDDIVSHFFSPEIVRPSILALWRLKKIYADIE